jgi:hypothetical protein
MYSHSTKPTTDGLKSNPITRLGRGEAVNQILEGKVDYHDADFTDFRIVEQERATSKKERDYER